MAAASSRSLPNLASVELDEITWTNEVIKAHKQDRKSKYLECQKYSFYQCLFFSFIAQCDSYVMAPPIVLELECFLKFSYSF